MLLRALARLKCIIPLLISVSFRLNEISKARGQSVAEYFTNTNGKN